MKADYNYYNNFEKECYYFLNKHIAYVMPYNVNADIKVVKFIKPSGKWKYIACVVTVYDNEGFPTNKRYFNSFNQACEFINFKPRYY